MNTEEKISSIVDSLSITEENTLDIKVLESILINAGITSEDEIKACRKLFLMSYIKEKLNILDNIK